MIKRLRAGKQWQLAGVLAQADRPLAVAWWILLALRGVLPALFAIALGGLVGAVQRGGDGQLAAPLVLVGIVFVLLQVLAPIHHAVGANLGSRTSAWLYDRLTTACVRVGHARGADGERRAVRRTVPHPSRGVSLRPFVIP